MRTVLGKSRLLLLIGFGLFPCLQSCKKDLGIAPEAPLGNSAATDTGVRVSTYAGSTQGYVDGPVSSAQFMLASYLCMGPDSALYVADDNRIRKIGKNGDVSTLAGGATKPSGEPPLDGTGTQAAFVEIGSMTIAPTGLIYISEGFYARTVSQQGQVLTLGYGFGPNDVVLAAAPDNTLYGSQTDYSSVHVPVSIVQRRLTGEVIRSEALEWNQYVLSMIVARNNAIYILASTASGDRLYKITDSKIYPVALAPVTLVRREKATYGVQVDAIQYSGAYDRLAVAADGTVYIAGQHQIWKVTPGGTLSILAGSTEAGYEDGPAAQARFQQIFALELADNDGVLYVSDDFRIRRIMLK